MNRKCEYRAAYDPDTLEPLGPACGATPTQVIHWTTGATSPACKEHGINILTMDALGLVATVESVDAAILYETGQA